MNIVIGNCLIFNKVDNLENCNRVNDSATNLRFLIKNAVAYLFYIYHNLI
ncbi:hypothetical protein HBA_0132 [Sodalis endosymbiont of Henestaris halophilus]|nr:hypothetical protein HBA_0132 [Sodalis endosymbiont of Henestaris halophilus]